MHDAARPWPDPDCGRRPGRVALLETASGSGVGTSGAECPELVPGPDADGVGAPPGPPPPRASSAKCGSSSRPSRSARSWRRSTAASSTSRSRTGPGGLRRRPRDRRMGRDRLPAGRRHGPPPVRPARRGPRRSAGSTSPASPCSPRRAARVRRGARGSSRSSRSAASRASAPVARSSGHGPRDRRPSVRAPRARPRLSGSNARPASRSGSRSVRGPPRRRAHRVRLVAGDLLRQPADSGCWRSPGPPASCRRSAAAMWPARSTSSGPPSARPTGVCLLLALIQGQSRGWSSPVIVSLFVAFIALGAAFLFVERRSWR